MIYKVILFAITIVLTTSNARKPKHMREYLKHLQKQYTIERNNFEQSIFDFPTDFQKFKELPENKEMLKLGLFGLYKKAIEIDFSSTVEYNISENNISIYFPIKSDVSAKRVDDVLKDPEFYKRIKLHIYHKRHFRFFGRTSLFPFFKEEYLLKAPNLRNTLFVQLLSELVPSIGKSTFFLNFADKRGRYYCDDSREFFINLLEVQKHLQDENHYLKAEEIYEAQDKMIKAKKWALNKEL